MEVRSIETIVRALNEAGVQYLIVGGLAVNAHGYVGMSGLPWMWIWSSDFNRKTSNMRSTLCKRPAIK
jgi:hypothetical protein